MHRFLIPLSTIALAAFGVGCQKEEAKPQSSARGLSPVGVISAADYQVVLFTGPDGPLYTVKGPDGRELATTIDAARFQAEYPSIFQRFKGTWAGADVPAGVADVVELRE